MWQRLIFTYLTALAIFCICIETSPSDTHKPLDNHGAIPGEIRVKRQSLWFTIPRVFGVFGRVVKETQNDTKSAVKQISDILSQVIVNTPTTQQPPSTMSTTEGTAESLSTTTTERFTVSRDELVRIFRRNYRGLVRLFNQEVDIALNDSNFNVAVARAEFRESVRQALLPATTTTSTTTSTTTESIVPRLGDENA